MTGFIIAFFTTIIIIISLYAISVCIPGLELTFMPVIFLMFILGLSGLITIPISIYRLIRKEELVSGFKVLIGITFGVYFSRFGTAPISNWDEEQRNLSGRIINSELELYKSTNNFYPASLEKLSDKNLNDKLPSTYKLDRFFYRINNNDFILYISIPIFDRWLWDKDKNEFVYDDF